MQDAAVLVVIDFVQGIDAAEDVHRFLAAVAAGNIHSHRLAGFQSVFEAIDGDGFIAFQIERLPRVALFELQRQDAHADEI